MYNDYVCAKHVISVHYVQIPDSALMKRLPWRWTMEHVVLPCLRNDFVPLKEMAEDGTVLQISDLKDLYKVFERC